MEIAGLQCERLTRMQSGLGQGRKERVVPARVLGGLEERITLLPRHRTDLVHMLRRGELVSSGLSAAEQEGRLRRDDAVVRGIGDHHGQRGFHLTDSVLRVSISALAREERLDVASLDVAEL